MNRAVSFYPFIKPVFLLAIAFSIAFAKIGFAESNSSSNGTSWQVLRVGAGGYVTGLDMSADGLTRVVRTDTYGAYIWSTADAQWHQLVTADSMPASERKVDNNAGVYEIRVSASLPSRLYMAYLGFVYRSDDRGESWTRTTFSNVPMNPNDNYRMLGQKIAIDPANPEIVFFGTSQNGLFVTTDGGATWKGVSAVPRSQKEGDVYPGIDCIEFSPAQGDTNGKTDTIFAASYGNGVYESTDGGVSWNAIGGPKSLRYAAISSAGIYYGAGTDNAFWSYENGAWKKLTTVGDGIQSVAINPFNEHELVLMTPGGGLDVSYNSGATWSGINRSLHLNSMDIPWLSSSGLYMTVGGTMFDRNKQNELWVSDGVGVWTTTLPATDFTWQTPVIWNDRSVGIEQLVTNEVLAPPGGKPVVATWDRGFFYINSPDTYPSSYGPVNGSFVAGWSLDYASSNPSFVVGVANWGNTEESGYSNNGGNTWKPFASYPRGTTDRTSGGSIAASTATSIVWVPTNNASPYYTSDGGITWKIINIEGVPTAGDTGWGWAYYLNRHIVTADRVTIRTYYAYNYLKGLYRSADGGATWALVHPGQIAPWSSFNAKLAAVPDNAGHLFFTSGPQEGDHHPAANPFMRSINGGSLWSAVPNVLEVRAFGFGKGISNYPTIYIVGWVSGVYGIWRSDDNARSWTKIGDFPLGSLDRVKTIEGDKNTFGTVYIGFGGSGFAYGFLKK